jgi:hypothetical protein
MDNDFKLEYENVHSDSIFYRYVFKMIKVKKKKNDNLAVLKIGRKCSNQPTEIHLLLDISTINIFLNKFADEFK